MKNLLRSKGETVAPHLSELQLLDDFEILLAPTLAVHPPYHARKPCTIVMRAGGNLAMPLGVEQQSRKTPNQSQGHGKIDPQRRQSHSFT